MEAICRLLYDPQQIDPLKDGYQKLLRYFQYLPVRIEGGRNNLEERTCNQPQITDKFLTSMSRKTSPLKQFFCHQWNQNQNVGMREVPELDAKCSALSPPPSVCCTNLTHCKKHT